MEWIPSSTPAPGESVKLWNTQEGNTLVLDSSGECIGTLNSRYGILDEGIYCAVVSNNSRSVDVTFWGVGETPFRIE